MSYLERELAKPIKLQKSYTASQGIRAIVAIYNEVERLDVEIERQRRLSRDPRVPGIDRLVAERTVRVLNALRASRISVARQIEKRIEGDYDRIKRILEEDHWRLDTRSPSVDYVERFYRKAIRRGELTFAEAEAKIMEIRSFSDEQMDHAICHLGFKVLPLKEFMRRFESLFVGRD